MGYPIPTAGAFKAQFSRDFPYAVTAYGASALLTIVAGVITVASVENAGVNYDQTPDVEVEDLIGSGAVITATVAQGKVSGLTVVNGGSDYSAGTRALISGGGGDETNNKRVTDADIVGAIFDAQFNVSQSLFDGEPQFQRALLYLSAHCLVQKLLAAGEGLASQFSWLITSKGAGDVNTGYAIPEKILKDPMLSMFSTTRYGMMYLQIISPLLIGNVQVSRRFTLP